MLVYTAAASLTAFFALPRSQHGGGGCSFPLRTPGGDGEGRLVRAAPFLALGLALAAGWLADGPGNIAGMPGGRMLCLGASALGPVPNHFWSAG